MPFKFVFHLFTHFWSLAIKGTVPSGFAGGVKTVDKQSIFYNAPNIYRLQLTFNIFNLKKHKWVRSNSHLTHKTGTTINIVVLALV